MTHDERMHQLLYSNEGRVEQCERICRLEELVRDMWDFYCVVPDEPYASKEEIDFSVDVWRRMRELGVD